MQNATFAVAQGITLLLLVNVLRLQLALSIGSLSLLSEIVPFLPALINQQFSEHCAGY
jgi:predicted PurR-regulated permease PerM